MTVNKELDDKFAAECFDTHDDAADHDKCADCKGTGWYIGFTETKYCPTCDGSGWL